MCHPHVKHETLKIIAVKLRAGGRKTIKYLYNLINRREKPGQCGKINYL